MTTLILDTFAGINEGEASGPEALSLKMQFDFGASCGTTPDYCPGVGLSIQSNFIIDSSLSDGIYNRMKRGNFYHGGFVMSRTDAARLRDELEIFLKANVK